MTNCLDISELNIRYQENMIPLNPEDTKENSSFSFLQYIFLGFRTIGVVISGENRKISDFSSLNI